MDFNELKALVKRMLRQYGYTRPYTVGPDELLTGNNLGVSFHVTRARDGMPDIIRLQQPELLDYFTPLNGLIRTPYERRRFNAGDFKEVFASVLRQFVECEMDDS